MSLPLTKYLFLLNIFRLKDNIYLKKNISSATMIKNLLDKKFNGIFLFKDDNFNLFKQEYSKEYFINDFDISDRALRGVLERISYLPIGESIFQSVELFPNIPDSLLRKVTNYIDKQRKELLQKEKLDICFISGKSAMQTSFLFVLLLFSAAVILHGSDFKINIVNIAGCRNDYTTEGEQAYHHRQNQHNA